MFTPAEMRRIDIQISEDYVSQATMVIAQLNSLHLLNIRKLPLGGNDLDTPQENVFVNKYRQIKVKIEHLCASLGFIFETPNCPSIRDFDPYEDILDIEKEVQKIENEVNEISNRIKSQNEIKIQKQELLRLFEMIFSLGIDLSQFYDCKFLYLAVGLIPTENIEKLGFSLANIYHILIPSTTFGKRRLCFVLASKKDEEKLNKAFDSAFFKKLDISLLKEGLDEGRLQGLRKDIHDIEIDINLAHDYLEKLKRQVRPVLEEINTKTYLALVIMNAAKSFDKVGDNYHIAGWVPRAIIPVLKREIKRSCPPQKVLIMTSSALRDESNKKRDILRIPTCLKNPSFLKPFEKLIFGYDVPSYNEVEPTFFFAIGFLLMFGVMFGDVGHGLILFLLGLFILKKIQKESIKQIGLIVMECGAMSILFGFLYGSIFGFEHILPALWFHPIKNIYYFMKVAVGFGIGIISLGLILNIINSIKNGDWLKGIFGEMGMMGLLFYWGCVGLLISYMVKGNFILKNTSLMWLLILPLLAIFLKEPFYNIYNRMVLKRDVKIIPSGLGLYILESIIEIGDTIIGFLSNTVSFIRISAFALAHAGLFMAVFALAQTMQNIRGGVLWYWLIVIFGNIGIIIIEGLVVSIQTIRLEYYEFFSKFFKGGGELYHPLKS